MLGVGGGVVEWWSGGDGVAKCWGASAEVLALGWPGALHPGELSSLPSQHTMHNTPDCTIHNTPPPQYTVTEEMGHFSSVESGAQLLVMSPGSWGSLGGLQRNTVNTVSRVLSRVAEMWPRWPGEAS